MSGEPREGPTCVADVFVVEEPSTKIAKAIAARSPPTCRAITPPNTDACGKPAKFVVTFGDGDAAPMCQGCALFVRQLAEAHGTTVKVERSG